MEDDREYAYLKRPTAEQVVETAVRMKCFFCRSYPAGAVYKWEPLEDEKDAVVIKSVVCGLGPPQEGVNRTLLFALCKQCREPYADGTVESMTKLHLEVKKRFLE